MIWLKDPKQYVSTILEVHKRYHQLVTCAFKNEPGFVQSLDKACTAFINRNNVTKKANVSDAMKMMWSLLRLPKLKMHNGFENKQEGQRLDNLCKSIKSCNADFSTGFYKW